MADLPSRVMEAAQPAQVLREGTSSTPLDGKISKGTGGALYRVMGAGLDEIRVTLSVSGDSARVCEGLSDHAWRPKGMPGMFFLGRPFLDGYRRSFEYLLGRDEVRVMYHRDSSTVHARIHFPGL